MSLLLLCVTCVHVDVGLGAMKMWGDVSGSDAPAWEHGAPSLAIDLGVERWVHENVAVRAEAMLRLSIPSGEMMRGLGIGLTLRDDDRLIEVAPTLWIMGAASAAWGDTLVGAGLRVTVPIDDRVGVTLEVDGGVSPIWGLGGEHQGWHAAASAALGVQIRF